MEIMLKKIFSISFLKALKLTNFHMELPLDVLSFAGFYLLLSSSVVKNFPFGNKSLVRNVV